MNKETKSLAEEGMDVVSPRFPDSGPEVVGE